MNLPGTLLVISGALLLGRAAQAADKINFAPSPSWVKAVAVPTDVKSDDAPVRLLLSDQQIAFARDSQTIYSETALKIQSPQGLAAGNISLPWDPATATVTVHKLLIRRGDQVIDVLGAGQTFTILRREQNLESAMLDGVLTANIQPEGLQVGDIVDFAVSVTSSDPVMKGHVEFSGATWNGLPLARAHLRAQWPNGMPIRLRQAGRLPPLKPVRTGAMTMIELSLDNLVPVLPPKGAPARYRIGRLVELSDFAAWADVGALMAPLYDKAAVIPAKGALRDELTRIEALSPDPGRRAEAALALVQDRVRYVALVMGQGGYVPADAETTWSRRYGDCKGKSALLLALLHGLGIEAEPVAVNAIVGDGIDQRLPMVGLFNHVIVRAMIGGKTYWLDGTRSGDTSLDRLRIPDFGWGLPMVAKGAALVRMVPPPLEIPDRDISIHIDARGGISAPAPARLESVLRGDEALGAKIALDNLAGEARERALKEYWSDRYDFIEVKSVSASFDAKKGEEHLTMEGVATLDWANGNYQTDGTNVGYHADFAREPGSDQDAPFAVAYPFFTRMRETILLPKGQGTFRLGPDVEVDQTAGGIAYRRHATIADDVFTIEQSERSVVSEFAAKDAPAEQAALRKLESQQTSIVMPGSYRQTSKDLDAARSAQPTSSADFVRRAALLGEAGRDADALQDYGKAIELDPKNGHAWIGRAALRARMGDLSGARGDLQKSEAIDPNHVWNFLVAGTIAETEHRLGDAIAAYTQAIEHQFDGHNKPLANMAYPYWRRAQVYAANDMFDAALADYNKGLALVPNAAPGLLGRAMLHIRRGNLAEARADIAKAAAADANGKENWTAKGMLAELEKRSGDAISAYSKVIDQQPRDAFALGHRAFSYAQRGDLEHAFEDAGAALKIDPTWVDLRTLRAWRYIQTGKSDAAIAEVRAAVTLEPRRAAAHAALARTLAQLGRRNEALGEYGEAIAIDPQPMFYVERSFARAEDDLTGRRADIDAALRLDPRSKEALAASAKLQQDQGNARSAIAKWAELVAARPGDPEPFFERAKAYLASGDTGHALEDSAAALKLQPRSPEIFLFRANIFRRLGKAEDAVREAAAVEAAMPDSSYAHVVAANIYSAFHRDAEASKAYDRALAVKPDAFIYLNRGKWRPHTDAAGRMADFEAALKLDPHMPDAIVAKATQQRENGDLRAAIETYDAAIAAAPDEPRLLIARGVARSLAGDMALADKDFADARAKGDSAQILNEICWSKAIAGVALESALADCDAALGKQPESAAILDSRAFVELRLGRLEAAIADYDKALAKSPNASNSLFGRAVARARQGDKAGAAADASAALKIDPDVRSEFERYGVKM